FFQAEDGIRDRTVTGVQTCALPILDDAVAVVADDMWAAKRGLASLTIRWDDGPNAAVSTDDVVAGLAAAAQSEGVVARNEGNARSEERRVGKEGGTRAGEGEERIRV